jgi:hypothetical protein
MAKFIESLESRQLFSTVPAVGILEAGALGAFADFNALKSTGHSNFLAIEAELKSAGEIKSSAAALRALASHATAAENALSKNLLKTKPVLLADIAKLTAAASHLSKKPTSSALQKAESTAVAKFQKDASARLTAITTAITKVASTDELYAGQIETQNSGDANLKTTLSESGALSSAARATLSTAATTVLTTDVTAAIVALTGKPF